MTITRYAPAVKRDGKFSGMWEMEDGDYVLHADHLAALTAIERAAYERGVRDAADAVPVDQYHESWMARMLVCARVRILALLTQEGR